MLGDDLVLRYRAYSIFKQQIDAKSGLWQIDNFKNKCSYIWKKLKGNFGFVSRYE